MSEPVKPLQGRQLLLASIAAPAAGFMAVLDTSIANISVPSIAGSLGVSPQSGAWVITSYAVAEAIVVPLTGWLSQRLGMVRLFVLALLGFSLMSLACGLSGSLAALVGFRVLQGIAGGPLLALTQTLLYVIYPRDKVMVGQAIFGLTVMCAPLLGPILGGWISDHWSWQWIFLINIPIGLLAAAVSWRVLREVETQPSKAPVDGVGLLLMVVAIGCLQLVLDKGRELDWFGSSFIITLSLISLVAFVFFIAWELTDDNPVVNLRLFRYRNFSIGVVMLSLTYGLFFGSVVLTPLWLQQFLGYPSSVAGWSMAPSGILVVLLSPVVARYASAIDTRLFLTAGLLVMALTFGLRLSWSPDVDQHSVMLAQFIQGAGSALFFLPLSQMSLGELEQKDMAMGAGLQNFVRTASGAFATSLCLTLWDHQTIRHHAELAMAVSDYAHNTRHWLEQAQALGLQGRHALALLEQQITQQAAMRGMIDYFAWCVPGFVLLLALTWCLRPTARPLGADAPHG